MSRRYTYSRQIVTQTGSETFTAVEFDSFDEAINAVEKGIREYRATLPAMVQKEYPGRTTTVNPQP